MKYMLMVLGKQADYDAMGGAANGDGPGPGVRMTDTVHRCRACPLLLIT